jgi:hypothetical protein
MASRRNRLTDLRCAWKHCTPAERSEFLEQIGAAEVVRAGRNMWAVITDGATGDRERPKAEARLLDSLEPFGDTVES